MRGERKLALKRKSILFFLLFVLLPKEGICSQVFLDDAFLSPSGKTTLFYSSDMNTFFYFPTTIHVAQNAHGEPDFVLIKRMTVEQMGGILQIRFSHQITKQEEKEILSFLQKKRNSAAIRLRRLPVEQRSLRIECFAPKSLKPLQLTSLMDSASSLWNFYFGQDVYDFFEQSLRAKNFGRLTCRASAKAFFSAIQRQYQIRVIGKRNHLIDVFTKDAEEKSRKHLTHPRWWSARNRRGWHRVVKQILQGQVRLIIKKGEQEISIDQQEWMYDAIAELLFPRLFSLSRCRLYGSHPKDFVGRWLTNMECPLPKKKSQKTFSWLWSKGRNIRASISAVSHPLRLLDEAKSQDTSFRRRHFFAWEMGLWQSAGATFELFSQGRYQDVWLQLKYAGYPTVGLRFTQDRQQRTFRWPVAAHRGTAYQYKIEARLKDHLYPHFKQRTFASEWKLSTNQEVMLHPQDWNEPKIYTLVVLPVWDERRWASRFSKMSVQVILKNVLDGNQSRQFNFLTGKEYFVWKEMLRFSTPIQIDLRVQWHDKKTQSTGSCYLPQVASLKQTHLSLPLSQAILSKCLAQSASGKKTPSSVSTP